MNLDNTQPGPPPLATALTIGESVNPTSSNTAPVWSDWFTKIWGKVRNLPNVNNALVASVWVTATLQNGWVAIAGYPVPAYMIDALGFVHFRGALAGGVFILGTVILTLPAGYRPTALYQLFTVPNEVLLAVFTGNTCDLIVNANGTVQIGAAVGAGVVSIDGVAFSVAP